jgi:hypothetical protein
MAALERKKAISAGRITPVRARISGFACVSNAVVVFRIAWPRR